ncbi:type I-E CRISPR-associated protein Cas7/Cse4/CasC [Specibacter cremeus]|uniref:type I-E CRISPR-associated protein Cas7/Cse4/CasC n=1 Tax=Specibacter cremeus TaxID=1629051 RepID=UPI000F7A9A83|nr:type I-E CRISPR-associated protein Cas7/Cse4/CasC [Specibacter cremeus]
MSKVFVDIHVLQTVPPSNINRDDTGSPKTAVFGGTRRARVSSQAWKRAVRQHFKDYLDVSELGTRTKRVVDMVAKHVKVAVPDIEDLEANTLAEDVLKAAGFKLEKVAKKGQEDAEGGAQSGYLMFVSNLQAQKLAALAVAHRGNAGALQKKDVKAILTADHSVDIALFGRMVADSADINVDASAQVAHAISVHPVETEFDYFTAVDDSNTEEETGAGMIGTVEFNSSTLYRYATVNVAALAQNLGDAAATTKATTSFVKSFIESMPTGKQNTFANRTLPDAVVVTLRTRQPVNLVGAFEDAVEARDGKSRLQVAAERLADQARDLDAAYDASPSRTFVISPTKATAALEGLGEKVSLTGLLEALGDELTVHVGAIE